MEPALKNGQRFVVNRLAHPGINDLVVASIDSDSGRRDVVKRVVATAGDTIGYLDCVVVRNGDVISESLASIPARCVGDFSEINCAAGPRFLLGDNRAFSADSRSF